MTVLLRRGIFAPFWKRDALARIARQAEEAPTSQLSLHSTTGHDCHYRHWHAATAAAKHALLCLSLLPPPAQVY
jgi:hypothetical protein